MKRLTAIVHERLSQRLRPGDLAIDATAGNGHDTRFLAGCVGPTGQVYAIDIQTAAIAELQDNVPSWVTLIQGDHARMASLIPAECIGRVAAVVFNLGYRPGGDKAIITTPSSTIAALEIALRFLKPGGCLSVIAYPAHDGGAAEAAAVEKYFAALGTSPLTGAGNSPRLYWHVRENAPEQ